MRPTSFRTLALLALGITLTSLGLPAGTAQDSRSEIQKRLDYWKKSPDADLLFQGVPPDPSDPVATTTGPKAVALCVGVDFVSSDHYGDIAPRLYGAVRDARDVARWARKAKFDVTLMTDERATTGAVTQFLTEQAPARTAGDTLFIYFAGSGAQYREPKAKDRTFAVCLYDRMLLFDELFESLAQFKTAGVNIVLVTDVGRGEANKDTAFNVVMTAIDKAKPRSKRLADANERWSTHTDILRQYDKNPKADLEWEHNQPGRWKNVRVRQLLPGEARGVYTKWQAYRDVEGRKLRPWVEARETLTVPVTHLAAAGTIETPVSEVNGVGVFTSVFLDSVEGQGVMPQRDLIKVITKRLKEIGQTPNDDVYGNRTGRGRWWPFGK